MNYLLNIKLSIEKFDTIFIYRHIVPDGDAYGSQIGLKLLIEKNYPDKKVYIRGENIEYLNFIGKMDNDNYNGNYNNTLSIITDCGNRERIDDQRFSKSSYIIKIDHHPNKTPFGDICWVDTSYSSASEMIADLAINSNWEITKEAARVIYHGIVTDSGRFLYKSTSYRTLDLASKLIKVGFDVQELYDSMYEKNINTLKLESELINNARIINNVGIIIINDEMIKKYNLKYEECGKFSNLLKNIKNVDIWVTFSIMENSKYRVEFRSKKIPINEIAIKYGGGGHLLASGTIIDDIQTYNLIINDLINLIKNKNN